MTDIKRTPEEQAYNTQKQRAFRARRDDLSQLSTTIDKEVLLSLKRLARAKKTTIRALIEDMAASAEIDYLKKNPDIQKGKRNKASKDYYDGLK